MRYAAARLWRFFQSRTLALVLLGVVAGAVAIASLVPQQGRVDPQAHAAWRLAHPLLSRAVEVLLLDRVYSSWWFYLSLGLLLANTFVCTLTRIPSLLRQGGWWSRLEEEGIKGLRNWAATETPRPAQEMAASVRQHLLRRGYQVAQETLPGKTFLFAQKGELSQWGSLLFHLSFLVVLVGVVWVQLTRYGGTMVITEGQTVTEQRQDYLRMNPTPPLRVKHQGFQVRLERFVPTYYQGMVGTDYAAALVVEEGGRAVKRQWVRVNQPLRHQGVRFLLEKYGFAPLFVLKDAAGGEVFASYVNLSVLTPGSQDFFPIPGTLLTLWATFYPDLAMEESRPATRSLLPRNPVLYLRVTEGEREVLQGPLPLKGSLALGEQSLTFADLRYWAQFQVIRDPGKEIIFGGLWAGLLGLALRYLITPKRVWALVREGPRGAHLTIGGTAPQLDSLFGEEFTLLIQELRKEGSGEPV